jgi:histidyl-tRNA synthetase
MSSAMRLKARLPRGFGDRDAGDVAATARMMETIRKVYELYGFEAVETPFIEFTDALGKFLPDQDRPNEGVFSFQDEDEQWLSLRYDLTAPLARYVAENYERLPKPYRSYRAGWVFRNEKPGPGRFRQFMQFDADTVGAPSIAADAEICMMAADTLEAVGIPRGQYVIKVNNRKILDGIMEMIGLRGEENSARRLIVLRAIDKLDRFGVEGFKQLLGRGRMDESGDFTKGAELEQAQIDMASQLLAFGLTGGRFPSPYYEDDTRPMGDMDVLESEGRRLFFDNSRMLDALERSDIDLSDSYRTGISELRTISKICESSGYGSKRIVIAPEVVRGLEYYTGPVFEAELTFQVTGDDGQQVRFGSIGGGGRYDGLVSRFLGEAVPATGFSIGVSRLLAALKAVKSPIVTAAANAGPVVVLVMDRENEALAAYQAMVQELRAAGIRAELYLGASGMKAQMKYADRRSSPCVIIHGSNERAADSVQIKDLVEGKRLAEGIADNKEWRESRPAQVTVTRADLVATVREILARQEADAS